jgi:hypothetical protein
MGNISVECPNCHDFIQFDEEACEFESEEVGDGYRRRYYVQYENCGKRYVYIIEEYLLEDTSPTD